MDNTRTIIERAFDIAQSGKAKTFSDVCLLLKAEGYFDIQKQLEGRTLKKTLTELCHAAQQTPKI